MWLLTSLLLTGKVIIDSNIPYVEDGSRFHSLDIYAPEGCEKCPVIVFIHGGAWRTGDKGNHRKKGIFFAQRGLVFVSINYRTFPHATFPLFVEDASDAVAWVHRNIGRYGGDGNSILLMGHSAGAHIASMVAYERDFLAGRGIPRSAIKGLILLDGATYDLLALRDSFPALFERFVKPVFTGDDKQLKRASPVHHIRKGYNPPSLLIHTGRRASVSQARVLAAKLSEVGSPVQTYCACGMSHRQVNTGAGEDNPLTERILKFAEQVLHMENLSPR